jgi:hypothetical protein
MTTSDPAWVPDACSLPTAERPLRLAEFDDLFATAVRRVEPVTPAHARLHLTGGTRLAATVRDLTARETQCCSFFRFTASPGTATEGEALILDIEVPAQFTDVLAALITRASSVSAGRAAPGELTSGGAGTATVA